MKIGAIIQARIGSTRLPGKVMMKLEGKTVLEHVIERVTQSKLINEIVIATTIHERDSVIESEAFRCGVKTYRGSEDDVLSRYYYAAKENDLDVVVRITSDCPLIDPLVLDDIINCFLENEYSIVSNAGSDLSNRTFPRGLDTEVFSFKTLEKTHNNANARYQREHVTPYIYEKVGDPHYFKNDIDYSKYRWTLDTNEDYQLIAEVYKYLYHGTHNFYLSEIVDLFNQFPELYAINSQIEQKESKNPDE